MIIPKGNLMTESPKNTPPNERMTEVMIMSGWETELNWVTRMRMIRNTAAAKAFERNA